MTPSLIFTSWCIVLIGLSLLLWWFWQIKSNRWRTLRRLPGPRPLPLFGNLFHLIAAHQNLTQTFHQWALCYGEVFAVWMGHHCYVFVSWPPLMETILNSTAAVVPPSMAGLAPMALNDNDRNLEDSFIEASNEQSLRLCAQWLNQCRSKVRFQVDVFPLMAICSLRILCDCCLGCIADDGVESELVVARGRIGQIAVERWLRPWLRFDRLFRLTELGSEYDRCQRVLRSFSRPAVEQRRQRLMTTTFERRRTVIDQLLERSSSVDDVVDQVESIMSAGHDAMATALSWFLYCMAANPNDQERLHDELEDVFGNSDRICCRQDLEQLSFLELCLKESLRLYPSVPYFDRYTINTVQIGDYEIPAGCTVRMLPYAAHRDERLYAKPQTFDPHRLAVASAGVGRSACAYLPFGAEPSGCAGRAVTQLTIKVVASNILRCFRFRLAPDAEHGGRTEKLAFETALLRPCDGVQLLVSARH